MKNSRAILFDLDGVLVHTELLKAQAHAATVKQYGGKNIPISFYSDMLGQSHERVRSSYLKAGGINIGLRTYTRTYREIYRELLLKNLKRAEGSIELLQRLAQKSYMLVVVSSSDAKVVDQILVQTNLAKFFDLRICADDVKTKKPAPDAYLLALDKLAVTPRYAVAIEDSEAGAQAAIAAGVKVIAIRHSLNVHHRFDCAYTVFRSLREIDEIVKTISVILNSRPS